MCSGCNGSRLAHPFQFRDARAADCAAPQRRFQLVEPRAARYCLLDLRLRLGEGSGAALALPLVAAARAILVDMATFADAGVSDTGR